MAYVANGTQCILMYLKTSHLKVSKALFWRQASGSVNWIMTDSLILNSSLWSEGPRDGFLEFSSTRNSDFVHPMYSSLSSSCSPTPRDSIPAISTSSLFPSAVGSVPPSLNKGPSSRHFGMSEMYLILNQREHILPFLADQNGRKIFFWKFLGEVDFKGFANVFSSCIVSFHY